MKIAALLIIAFCFLGSSCKHREATKTQSAMQMPPPSQMALLEKFARSENYDEATLLAAAASLSKEGMASSYAERCWKKEARRPNVRGACLLAWSSGQTDSEMLESVLLEPGDYGIPTRVRSIAAVQKRKILRPTPLSELLALLAPLSEDPIWVRSLVLEDWVGNHPAPLSPEAANKVWASLNFSVEKNYDPYSLELAYSVAEKLGLPIREKILSFYCNPHQKDFAEFRCLRFLSTLVAEGAGPGLEKNLLDLLPNRKSASWTLFERNFPERAALLEKYL